jgi:hypothetical protein
MPLLISHIILFCANNVVHSQISEILPILPKNPNSEAQVFHQKFIGVGLTIK